MARKSSEVLEASERSVDTHKTSAVGMAGSQWFVAEVKPTRERTVREQLLAWGYEAYVPCQVSVRVYKNYTWHTSETPVIPGLVFVRLEPDAIPQVAAGCQAIYRFMPDRALSRDVGGQLRFATISETEMQQLKYVCGQAENPVLFSDTPLRVGQPIRVMRGPLSGVEGLFMEEGNSTFIVLRLSLGRYSAIRTEVARCDVQPV